MKLQLKRSSSTTGSANALVPVPPTAPQTLDGELCINFNAGDPALFIEDSGGNIRRLDGNSDNYALSTTSSTSKGDIVLTHQVQGSNAATTDTVSIVAGTNIAVSSDGTDITIASSVPASGQFGYWTRNSATSTLSPVNTNDNVSIGSGQFTTTTQYNGPKLTNAGGILEISTTSTATPVGDHDIDINTSGTGQVLVNTDVVIENGHELVLNQLATQGAYRVAHKAGDAISANTTYTWPVAPGASAYLTSDTSGNLSWTTGTTILTTVVGGAGLDATGTSGSSTTVSVDLKTNQGLRTIASGSLADAPGNDSELGLIAGSAAQDTLLWTVTGGASAITAAGASGQTTEPEGKYVSVTTTAATGSGCTVNFDVADDGTISNLTIANPGSGYGESQVLTIDGHQTEGPPPADITFTLETDANNGRYTYTGWRTGALTTAGGGGSGGDVVGIDGGPGIEIDESNTTTPKVSIDLAATNPGLEFTADDDTGELRVKPHNGITVGSSGVAAVGNQGITVDSNGISVDIANDSGLEFTGTAPNETLQVKDYHGITVNDNGVSVTAHNGIEVSNDGVSTRIHAGGGLSDTLNTNELGLADPSNPNTSNQVVVWKAAGAAISIALADTPNNVSDQAQADYINVATTVDSGAGSGLTVNFTVGAAGAIANLTISNPGSGYDAATPVCSVNGHGDLKVRITDKYAAAQWIAEAFAGGGGAGSGDVTGVQAGDGIDVATSDGPEPVVSVDVHADGGLTNRFDSAATAKEGELGLVRGVNTDDVMVWRGANSVVALNTIAATGALAIGDYTNVATTGAGTGLTVAFTIDTVDTAPASITVINPGSGYSDDDAIAITGFNLTCAVDGVNANARWQPGVDKNTTYDLSNTSVASGSRIDLSGSDNTLDSISITGSGATTVTHGAGTIQISSVNTSTILVQDGSDSVPDVAIYGEGQLWWNSDADVGKLFILYDDPGSGDEGGKVWVEASPKPEVPDIFPDLSNPGDQGTNTLDKRYLRIEAGAGNQTVASTGTTTFNGVVEAGSGVKITGGDRSTIGKGLTANIQRLYINSDRGVDITSIINNAQHSGNVGSGLNVNSTLDYTGTLINGNLIGVEDLELLNATSVDSLSIFSSKTSGTNSPSSRVGTCTSFVAAGSTTYGTDLNIGFSSGLITDGDKNYNFYATGGAPNFFKGDTYIGGSTSGSTRELWESTLTEEQKEQLSAGTLAIPANVSTPGDGSFVRQWWYDQQSAEDQALIDAGELEYPSHFQAANFVDTFALGENTRINLLSNGSATFSSDVTVARGTTNPGNGSQYLTITDIAGGHILRGRSPAINPKGIILRNEVQQLTDPTIQNPTDETPREYREEGTFFIAPSSQEKESTDGQYGSRLSYLTQLSYARVHGVVDMHERFNINREGMARFTPTVDMPASAGEHRTIYAKPEYKYLSKGDVFGIYLDADKDDDDYQSNPLTVNSAAALYIRSGWGDISNKANYGIRSNIELDGNKNFNFYAAGSAPNFFNGHTFIGSIGDGVPAANQAQKTVLRSDGRIDIRGVDGFPSLTVRADRPASATTGATQLVEMYEQSALASNPSDFISIGYRRDDSKYYINLGFEGNVLTASDYRLKSNIVDLPSATDAIKSLQPREYDFLDRGKRVGFVAHELQAVVPEAVVGNKDATEAIGTLADYDGTVLETEVTEPSELEYTEEVETTPYSAAVAATYDENGNELTPEQPEVDAVYTTVTRTRTWTSTGTRPVYQGVDQTKLIPLLTKALQEALDKIEVLEQRLSDAGIA